MGSLNKLHRRDSDCPLKGEIMSGPEDLDDHLELCRNDLRARVECLDIITPQVFRKFLTSVAIDVFIGIQECRYCPDSRRATITIPLEDFSNCVEREALAKIIEDYLNNVFVFKAGSLLSKRSPHPLYSKIAAEFSAILNDFAQDPNSIKALSGLNRVEIMMSLQDEYPFEYVLQFICSVEGNQLIVDCRYVIPLGA